MPGPRLGSRSRSRQAARPAQDGSAWPRPADPDAASRLRERFAELGPEEARLAGSAGRAALDALGGNSPFLADLAVREAETFRRVVRDGPNGVVADALAGLDRFPFRSPRPQVASALRRAKRQVALAVALADLGGAWGLEQVTRALSDLADAALRLSCAHLLRAAHDRSLLRLPNPDQPERGSGWAVLGMGKLGARELNYSSDVDLILFYDPERHAYHGSGADSSLGGTFSRLARDLVSLMEVRDADGYVFRTDLRLRPDPAATPPCVALPAALSYYESMGQNWERAAMVKARPVAADLECGAHFLAEIRPFVWRRGLDFAAVADIHAMKARVDAHKDTALPDGADPVTRLLGHDVKLGQGGIREIEFITQTLQLVWGGREPALRMPQTLEALPALAEAGHLSPEAVPELDAAYRALRSAEHRLQMVADRQTHVLPGSAAEIDRFAAFMGVGAGTLADGQAFAAGLLRHMDRVRARWAEVFDPVPPPSRDGEGEDGLDFAGAGTRPEAEGAVQDALRRLGFRQPEAVLDRVRGWRAGRPRALRSERARLLLDPLLPALMRALAAQADPDAAFVRLDSLLTRLTGGVQLLSLFQRNPALLERVAAVLGAAPQLADHLASAPTALDGLLAPAEVDRNPAATLRRQLGDARTPEDAISIVRRTVRGEEFRLGVAQMQGRLDADAAGVARTALADAALSALLPPVLRDVARRYGRVPGGAMAVVLLGKAGGREMMAGSDLDMMLAYDHPADAGASEGIGARSLPPSTWFIRAAHAYVAAVTAPGVEGPLYATDMRLRPSGNKGPVAVPLSGLVRYHREDAWTWERMALTRARVVAGPPELRRRVAAAIQEALALPADRDKVRSDAADMRARMLRELPAGGPWDTKLRHGGQVDVEFIAQVLQLLHGPAEPRLFSPTTRVALRRMRAAGHLARADAVELLRADRLWRTVQGMLRILMGRAYAGDPTVPDLPEAAAAALLHAAGAALGTPGSPSRVDDLTALRARMDGMAAGVRENFARYVGTVGDA